KPRARCGAATATLSTAIPAVGRRTCASTPAALPRSPAMRRPRRAEPPAQRIDPTESPMSSATPQASPLAHRDFRLLFAGSAISALGDQFTLVALPWLVLAAMALPRAAFMLIGGAVVDRLSPRRVLLWARAINAVLIGVLTLLVFAGAIRMPVVYALALGIGLSTAFAYPAGSALLPSLLPPQQLQAANALMMGARQLSLF